MFIDIDASDVSSTLAYAGGLVKDFMPLIVVILGIGIGVFVIGFIAKKLF